MFADPTVDFVFKKIFGTKEYSSATIDLINSFIEGINVQSVEFLNTVQDKESKNERTTIVDVLARKCRLHRNTSSCSFASRTKLWKM